MKISEFSKKITLKEGLKTSVSIAQVSEILKLVNKELKGKLYSDIKKLK